jgi:hypothetical protein
MASLAMAESPWSQSGPIFLAAKRRSYLKGSRGGLTSFSSARYDLLIRSDFSLITISIERHRASLDSVVQSRIPS